MKTKKILYLLFVSILFSPVINAQTWEWAKGVNDSDGFSTTNAGGILVDSAGYIYSVLGFKQPAFFSTCGLTSVQNNDSDFALVKYNSNGDCIWSKRGGGPGNDYSKIIGINKNNNTIYTAGQFGNGGGSIDGINFSAGIFIAKYDLNGNCYWGKTIITGGYYLSAILDNNDNFFISGSFSQPIQIDTVTINPQVTGEYESYIAKLNQDGKVIWIKQININTGISTISMPALSGDFYCTGLFYDTLIIDTVSLISRGSTDAFIVKFDTAGAVKWTKQIGGQGGEGYVKLTVINNSIYSLVRINNGFTSDCDTGTGKGVVLSKLDTGGNCMWGKVYPEWSPEAMTVDSIGNIILVGTGGGTDIFGCGVITESPFLVLLDSNGNCLNMAMANGSLWNSSVGMDKNNNVYLASTAWASPSAVFGSDTIHGVANPGPGYSTGFVAKLSGLITDTPPAAAKKHTGLFIFPNPSQQKYTLVIPEDIVLEGVMIRIFDSTGRLVFEEPANAHQQTLDLWGYEKGLYLVRVNVGAVDYVGRIVR